MIELMDQVQGRGKEDAVRKCKCLKVMQGVGTEPHHITIVIDLNIQANFAACR
jgi:hypothetical protein